MSERTGGPWVIYDDTNNLHVKIKGHHPRLGGAHVADVLDLANAAAIVRWENHFDDLVKGLEEIVLRGRRPIINTKDQYVYSAEAEIARAALAKVKS